MEKWTLFIGYMLSMVAISIIAFAIALVYDISNKVDKMYMKMFPPEDKK